METGSERVKVTASVGPSERSSSQVTTGIYEQYFDILTFHYSLYLSLYL